MRYVWIGYLALLALAASAAPTPENGTSGVRFQRVGSESGPPAEVITALYQDSTGFVWIGSRDGLSRYDGQVFKEYRYNAGDPSSISDNTIRSIFEDSDGFIWIGTNSGGLNRLDQASGKFEHFRYDSADQHTLSHDSVYAIVEDTQGDLWIGTQQGLNHFDRETGTFERFRADPSSTDSLSNDYVTCLLIDKESQLWVGTNGGGLNLLNRNTGRFSVYQHIDHDPQSLASDGVYALLEDQDGRLWIGSPAGISVMDPSSGAFEHIQSNPEDPTSPSHNLVVSLATGIPGKIWVGTMGGGLNEIDAKTGRCRVFRHHTEKNHSLGDDRVMSLLYDNDGVLWVGTWGSGLSRLTPTALLLALAAAEVPVPPNVTNIAVSGLAGDGGGGLWIGTRYGDLLHKKHGETTAQRFETRLGIIFSIVETQDGNVWVGTATGIFRIDTTSGEITQFQHILEDAKSLGPGYVNALLEDRDGNLWAGTGEGGLQLLSRDGRILTRILHDPDDPKSLSDNYVKSLTQDQRGTIWIGTRSGGLNSYSPDTGRVARYVPDAEDPESISHHYVTAIHEDSGGQLWIATGGGGLNRLERSKDGGVHFSHFTVSEGLIDNNVMAILEDDDGSLWLSTKRGLSRFDPKNAVFSNLSVSDGLPAAEFEPGAAARSAEALYFGSVKWLAAIPAGGPFPKSALSPIVITSIRDRHGDILGEQPPWQRENLAIPFGHWLRVRLAVLDFNSEFHQRYAFRLGDDDEEWMDLGPQHEITFMDLDPGVIEFAARGLNSRGVWSEISPTLTIRIPPPFWMSWWFRLLLVLGGVGVVAGVHRLRMSALEKRNRELLELHEQRERAREELRQAYDRLRQLTRRLEAAKEDERKRIARELHDDMGPSLTAVIINLQLIAASNDFDKTARWLSDSTEIVDRMVQQIRDISLTLRPPLLDEVGLVPALQGYLETLAARTGLEIDVSGAASTGELPTEIEITAFRVVQEATTNVVRHAKAQRIDVIITKQDGVLELTITDNGEGFDSRDTMIRTATGKALGLLGMEERVRGLNGDFEIDSAPGSGTRVWVRLPVVSET